MTNVPALDTARRFGEGYLFPSDVVLAALQAIDHEAGLDAIERVNEIDDLHALMDTQMLALIAWRRLLEEAKPVLRRTSESSLPLLKAAMRCALGRPFLASGRPNTMLKSRKTLLKIIHECTEYKKIMQPCIQTPNGHKLIN